MDEICGIYKITSPKNKIYIGQTSDMKQRFNSYRQYKCKGQSYLYKSLKRHGRDAHKFEIIHACSASELNELEIYYIELYNTFNSRNGLNLKSGGDRCKFSAESRARMSRSQMGKKVSNETRIKMGSCPRKKTQYLVVSAINKNNRYARKLSDEDYSYIKMNISNKSQTKIAKELKISQSTVSKLLKKWQTLKR